jgi:ATP-dependent DNA helicase RecG
LNSKQTHHDFRAEWRQAFVFTINEIEQAINYRNQRTPFKQGFLELDIWSFDLWSMREAINNAFAHRNYFNRTEPVIIKMSPDGIKIKSPGGLMQGVTIQNILDAEGKWRNRLLMETMQRIGLVERAGIGLDRIFIETIKNGKGMPNFDNTDENYVVLNIPAKIKDLNFVYYLEKIAREKQISFNQVKDFLELENIRDHGISSDKERIMYFCKNNLVEKIGVGRGVKYVLSKHFYEFIEKRSEYTRKKWLNKDEQKQIILNYLKDYKKGKVSDFKQLFQEKELTNQQINRLLKELSDKGVYFEGPQRSKSAYWKIKS